MTQFERCAVSLKLLKSALKNDFFRKVQMKSGVHANLEKINSLAVWHSSVLECSGSATCMNVYIRGYAMYDIEVT